ncbi:MAG: adenylosuccinate lyase [Proteobacteria bacterium]|nr:adenylosuccinate lyase [Pseudomonadota bacterium]
MNPAGRLTAISPVDGRYASKTQCLSEIASEYGLLKHRLRVEVGWLAHLSESTDIPEAASLSPSARAFLDSIIQDFDTDEAQAIKDIETRTNHDIKAIEYYLRDKLDSHEELRDQVGFIHFACTSEDINSTAYSLMLGEIRVEVLGPSIKNIASKLKTLAHELADLPMLSRTHGQPASPTTLGKEFANVHARLQGQLDSFNAVQLLAKMNGASGNYNAHRAAYPDVDWEALTAGFAETLGLSLNRFTTQVEPHDCIAEYCDVLRRINTILIDLCRDTWAYISIGYFAQKMIENEVGSSTMPHKINPIDFENAEGNFGVANALLGHFSSKLPISRWQRDLSDSTVLRNLGVAAAHCEIGYRSLSRGLEKLEVDKRRVLEDLENNPQVLTEAIQTVMRKHRIEGAYEKLKELSRGQSLDARQIEDFIRSLELPEDEKARLLSLTPANYTGLASELAKNA